MKHLILAFIFLANSISIVAQDNKFSMSALEIPDNKDRLLNDIFEKIEHKQSLIHPDDVRELTKALNSSQAKSFQYEFKRRSDLMHDYINAVYEGSAGSLSGETKEEIATVVTQNINELEHYVITIKSALEAKKNANAVLGNILKLDKKDI